MAHFLITFTFTFIFYFLFFLIGILDADVSFGHNYYASLINKFKDNPKLGVAGGIFFDVYNGKKVKVYPSPFSVGGATQFFRL